MRRSRPRLLIVDDQPSNVRVLASVLEDEYDVLFATSGEKALELAKSRSIDLVLLDVRMPGLDGFEVCRQLKADDRTLDTPVIFVTAAGEVEQETRGFDVGGVDYITKPISPAIVRARVRTHLELKETRDLLAELASIDGLTGLANRRALDQRLPVEWRRAARNQRWLSLMLLDIDHFKQFNDLYGHARGDDCLRRVASALDRIFRRPADLISRYGGEEFALVLPDTDPRGACSRVVELLETIQGLGIEHRASPLNVLTLSAGALSLKPSEDPTADGRGALEQADRLLYRAKQDGRNSGWFRDQEMGEEQRITIAVEKLA